MKSCLISCCLIAFVLTSNRNYAQKSNIIADTNITFIDASQLPYSSVLPGDTVFLKAGNRHHLNIKNFNGQAGKPIVFINENGAVIINTDHYFGILVERCRYVKLTGSGDPKNFYGFRVEHVEHGAGLSISDKTSDVEIEHVFISGTPIGGIYAKTDPDCSFTSTREKFTQFNTVIHDCYLTNIGNEGMYIGSSKYYGQVVNCNGSDTLLMPSLLSGVKVYNNILTYTGWDGIQVSSASTNCQVHDNLVLFDSQSEMNNQMSGIIIGGGSKCDCYNNYIANGKGIGIESHGLGGYRIFNNVIVNAGRTYFPDDPMKMKYGIYVTDVSVQQDSSFYILFNTIVNPKSDGIRFLSIKSKNSLAVSNAIINPGAFDFYENGGFSVKGKDSYVMIPNTASDLLVANNFFDRTQDAACFSDSAYRFRGVSPLVDAAYPINKGVNFDFDFKF